MKRVDEKIQEMLQAKVMPGVVWSIYQNKTWQTHAAGKQSILPQTQPMTKEAIFDIASLTKVVGTLSVVLQLIKEEKIAVTSPVQTYLPIKNQNLLIRHLLTHTSDFQGYIPNRDALPKQELSQALLTMLEPGNHLGKRVCYSDVNFIYLGWIAEKICQKPIQTLIQERVLTPLDMTTASFHPEKMHCVKTEQLENGEILQGTVHDPKARILRENCGSAGLFASVYDLQRFCEAYFEHRDILQMLAKNSLTPEGEQTRTLGWVLEEKENHYVLTHTGYTGTYLWLDLVEEVAVIFLSNRLHPVDDNKYYLKWRDEFIEVIRNAY